MTKEMKMKKKEQKKALKAKAPRKKGPLAVRIFAICALLAMLIPAGIATVVQMDEYFHPSAVSVGETMANQSRESIVKLNADGTKKDNPNMDKEPK